MLLAPLGPSKDLRKTLDNDMPIFGKPRLLGRRSKGPASSPGRNLRSGSYGDGKGTELLEGEVRITKDDGSVWARRYSLTREGSYSERRLDSGDDA